MKKCKIKRYIIVFAITLCICSCFGLNHILATSGNKTMSFTLDSKKLSLGRTMSYMPKNVTSEERKSLNWNSSNTGVATVDEKGKVTSVSRGVTTITVTKSSGGSASYELAIVPGKISMYEADGDEKITKLVLGIGDTKELMIQDENNSILNSEVSWSSSKEESCKVDENGLIEGLLNGSSRITGYLTENPDSKASVSVSVATPVSDIETDIDYIETYVGESIEIDYNVLPENAKNKKVKYIIEDTTVAKASSKSIKGISEGSTTVKISSISNPEVFQEVELVVHDKRDYKTVSTSDRTKDNDLTKYVDVNKTTSFYNEYPEDAVFTNKTSSIIEFSKKGTNIVLKGLEEGEGIIEVTYGDVTEKIEVLVNKYKSSNKDKNITAVESIKFKEDEDDSTKTIDYVNKHPLEINADTSLEINISPIEASVDDLQYSISNNKDFKLNSNGTITPLTEGKTTDFTVTSKTNPKVNAKIRLKSSLGQVSNIEFTKDYTGETSLNINRHKKFSFNPIIVMESGKTYNPEQEDLQEDKIYKALLKNVTISTDDTDILDIKRNAAYPIKDADGYGILTATYDDKIYEPVSGTASFEAVGTIVETIKSLKFVKTKYEINEKAGFCFNPIMKLNTGKTLDPTKDDVAQSEEYKNMLSKVQIEIVQGDDVASILGNNKVDMVYEGTAELKMFVVDNPEISSTTKIDINFNRNLKETINATMYISTKTAEIKEADDKDSNTVEELEKGTAIWVFEHYKNGYSRVAHNNNEQLYVKTNNLSKTQPKEKTSSSSSSSSSSSGSSSSSSSSGNSSSSNSSSGSSSSSSSENLKVEKEINANRYCGASSLNIRDSASTSGKVVGSVSYGAVVKVIEKYTNGWCKVEAYSGVKGYVNAQYLREKYPDQTSYSAKPTGNNGIRYTIRDNTTLVNTKNIKDVKVVRKNMKVELVRTDGPTAIILLGGVEYSTSRNFLGTEPPK